MADRRTINGTPWHVGFVYKDENEQRRHRARCIYYNKNTKTCKVQDFKCIGAAHCNAYKEYEEPKITEKQQKKIPDYIKRAQEDLLRKEKRIKKEKHPQKNISRLEDKQKLATLQPDKDKNNAKNKQKTKNTTSVSQQNNEQIKLPDYAYKGAFIRHMRYGNGLVFDVSKEKLSIVFSDGKEMEFDIRTLNKINVIKLRNVVPVEEKTVDLDDFMTPPPPVNID